MAEELPLSFRQAAMHEAEFIAALVNSGYRGESSKLGWTTEADLLDGTRTNKADIENMIRQPGSMVLLCTEGAEIIGTAHLELRGDQCQLGMLVIKPGLQGRGIGKDLMRSAEETARETWGVHRIAMTVISIRHELIAYYERRGYRRTGRTKPFVADDTHGYPKKSQPIEFIVMEKRLP
ncbi:MAG: GNAT family N-acetyltransferase [Steroidobacteraceae bacterium]